jgi:hypothetical protein
MIYVNPDDFLGDPRVFTDERNREASCASNDLVERTLAELETGTIIISYAGSRDQGRPGG